MGRCVLGGVVLLAMSLSAEAGSFVPTPSEAGAAIAARHGPAQILTRRHGTAVSFNWAGNAASGTTFTDAKGTWTQPAADCSKNPTQISASMVPSLKDAAPVGILCVTGTRIVAGLRSASLRGYRGGSIVP